MKKYCALFAVSLLFNSACLSQGQLWGVTQSGGANNNGAIYRMNIDGSNYKIHRSVSNTFNPGASPQSRLILGSNGKLYGTTKGGGVWNNGVIFEFDPSTGTYSKKFDFNALAGTGNAPNGLVQSSSGKFYGTTEVSEVAGSIFEFDLATNNYQVKYSFSVGSNGAYPNSALLLANNGKLYGTTPTGGANNFGVLFEYDISTSTFVKKIDFGSFGVKVQKCELIQTADGKIYGNAYTPSTGIGCIFEYDVTSNSLTKFNFGNVSTNQPGLYLSPSGLIFGFDNGTAPSGTGAGIFEFNPVSRSYTIKYIFGTAANDGGEHQGFTMGANGKLYGVSVYGGKNINTSSTPYYLGSGILYELDLSSGTYLKKFEFDTNGSGANPYGQLALAGNGLIYGTTSAAVPFESLVTGTLFQYNPSTGVLDVKYRFSRNVNGKTPNSGIVKANNGAFYGAYEFGGSFNAGTLFGVDQNYDPRTLGYGYFEMNALSSSVANPGIAASPISQFVKGQNGSLFCVASQGGQFGYGGIIEFSAGPNLLGPSTVYPRTAFTFDHAIKESGCGLSLANDGNLYGMTAKGGANGAGTIYVYGGSANITRHDFNSTLTGSTPYGNLLNTASGKMYGVTNAGGANSFGVLFEFDPVTYAVVNKFNFNSASGTNPKAGLFQATNGKLYGTTSNGGSFGNGTLYEFNPATGLLTKLVDFDNSIGKNSRCVVVQSPNGKLYGTTYEGGANNLGAIFEFDIATGALVKKLDFNGANGANPVGSLLFDSFVPKDSQTITFGALPNKVVGDPPFSLSATASSGLPVSFSIYTLPNAGVATISGNTVTMIGPGSVTVYADQTGDANYFSAQRVQQSFTVTNQAATIALSNLTQTYDGNAKPVTATTTPAGLANAITYNGSTTVPVAAGSYSVVASITAPGYTSTNATGTLVINKANQTITFSAIPSTICPLATVTLTATSSAGLPVSFASSSTSVASISGTTLTGVSGGNSTITASQAGNANFNAANVSQSIAVTPIPSDGTISANTTSICLGQSFTITSVGGTGTPYYWASTNGGQSWNVFAQQYGGQYSFTYTPTATGTYRIHLRNQNSCGFCFQLGSCATYPYVDIVVNATPSGRITVSPSTNIYNTGYADLLAPVGNSYLWNNGVTTQLNTVYSAGSFNVTVANGNCSRLFSVTITNTGSGGGCTRCQLRVAADDPIQNSDEPFSDQIDAFPNPASRLVTITLPTRASKDTPISMFDSMGKPIINNSIPAGQWKVSISVESIPIGLYLIKIGYGGENVFAVKKVIVERE